MSRTNCVNCGAAIDIDEIKCPFCGTTYLDMTAIDFNSEDPVVCKFLLPGSDKYVLSMLALPVLNEIQMQDETASITDGGRTIKSFVVSRNMTMDIHFQAVTHPKTQTLFTIKGVQ